MTRDRKIVAQLQRHFSGWNPTSVCTCKDLYGEDKVICRYDRRGQLLELHLCGLGLSDRVPEIPPEVYQLTNLQQLYLNYNGFRTFPKGLEQCANLEELHVARNHLTALPAKLGNLTKLRKLILYGNWLRMLPAELGQLTNLQTLNLAFNELTTLPAELGQLTALQRLTLNDNQLSSLPPELGNLTNLRHLMLSHNPFTTLPAELGNLTNLEQEDLEFIQLHLQQTQLLNVTAETNEVEANGALRNAIAAEALEARPHIPQPEAATRATPSESRLITIFYCYAHEDRDLRNRLDKHLGILKRLGQVTGWYDQEIQAGTEWAQEIDAHLDMASIILLLVSADFVHSDYCYGVEMQKALKMHEQGKARVLPILLRPVDWQDAPFAKLQILPTGAKPITKWPDPEEALEDVARQIRAVVNTLRSYKS